MNPIINKIVLAIKKEEDFNKAAQIMIENKLTISELSKKTLKLSQLDLAKLADKIFQKK
ncbi:hypothetical protein [Halarcobacter mediterraneus]|uniref:hypothetical protein n=1 Tax=Halarcobacter mediterraneus TaxID=2023153 RepID=UPI0013E98C24|nr:hypothetical protein [Halarcobacter mediterraneus]